jgi:hypothetical protein
MLGKVILHCVAAAAWATKKLLASMDEVNGAGGAQNLQEC